jgi:microcystin degradation protein MlrC
VNPYRIGIAGFLHESNTFLPVPTRFSNFEQASLTRGEALLERWSGSRHELGGFLEGARIHGFKPVPLLATFAVPSGTIETAAFEEIASGMIETLNAALPLDGLLVALHGATVAENHPDADGEMVRRLREVLGPKIPIIMTLDLHANVSEAMIAHTTAAVFYRSNPHLDQRERGLEATRLMAQTLDGKIQPIQAIERPPLLINIVRQHTQEAPARGLYDDVTSVLEWPGIVSASVAMGFYYADVAEMGASFLAVADRNPELARKAARWLAQRAWERRREFQGRLSSPAEAVKKAALSNQGPVALMDAGDNVGGGSPGDSTILMAEVLKQGLTNALVILYDPEAVQACIQAGVRHDVALSTGGKTDRLHGQPLQLRGTVRLISDGLFTETQDRHGGWGKYDQGVTAVVETPEQHTFVLTSLRMAPMSLEQLLSLGIKPQTKQVLIVKGVVAPRAAYDPVARQVILVDTPGLTCANPQSFSYQHRRRPLYPLETSATYR